MPPGHASFPMTWGSVPALASVSDYGGRKMDNKTHMKVPMNWQASAAPASEREKASAKFWSQTCRHMQWQVRGLPGEGHVMLGGQAWLPQRPAHKLRGIPYCCSGCHGLAGKLPKTTWGSRRPYPTTVASRSIFQLSPSCPCLQHDLSDVLTMLGV